MTAMEGGNIENAGAIFDDITSMYIVAPARPAPATYITSM